MSSHRPNNGLIGPQECLPGQELVRTYYKKNGEMVRSYCRDNHRKGEGEGDTPYKALDSLYKNMGLEELGDEAEYLDVYNNKTEEPEDIGHSNNQGFSTVYEEPTPNGSQFEIHGKLYKKGNKWIAKGRRY